MIGHYANLDSDISSYRIKVYDPNNKEFFQQDITNAKGKFSFTTREAGVHKVCFSPIEGQWSQERKKTRFSLRLEGGETNIDDIANKEHLSQLQILIMKLKDHAEDFIKMQEKNREDESAQVEVDYKNILFD